MMVGGWLGAVHRLDELGGSGSVAKRTPVDTANTHQIPTQAPQLQVKLTACAL